MRSLLLILLLSMSFITVKAQDKIITIKKDTIDCRIISVNADRISYEQKASDNKVVGKSIETSEVLRYFRSAEDEILQQSYPKKQQWEKPKHPLLFSLQSGLAYSLTDYGDYKNLLIDQGNPTSSVNDYIRKLKNGFHVSTSIHYLLTDFLGVGADYSFSYFSAEEEFLARGYASMNLPAYSSFKVEEKLITNFIGTSFLLRQSLGTKHIISISETISPGLIFLRNETRSNSYQIYWGDNNFYNGEPPYYYEYSNTLNHGNTFAIKAGLSLEYSITPQISAGLSGNYTWAKLNKLSMKTSDNEINDQELENDLDISRIDYGFIFRYNF